MEDNTKDKMEDNTKDKIEDKHGFIKDPYTNEERKEIAKKIKNISEDNIQQEMNKLIQIGKTASTMSPRSRVGNNIVDYFTFAERLKTRGKYNINFYEFIVNIDTFKKKTFIQNMLVYYETVKNKNKTKNEFVVLKEVYNICISAINIIRPLVYMEIYSKYKPKRILDFCAGWGGAVVAACALNIENYIGIEINHDLKIPYDALVAFLNKKSKTNIQMIFDNALNIDYTTLYYDFVFTSPPYYFIQKYENNDDYKTKCEMNEQFYVPLFSKTYNGLQNGGIYIINVCKEVYENVLIKLLGHAHDVYPYKKSKRQNNYDELIYVWTKTNNI
jgi:tRNA1(Val) A37 N6-methylase TrmN6